jgi:hypothetical protein
MDAFDSNRLGRPARFEEIINEPSRSTKKDRHKPKE